MKTRKLTKVLSFLLLLSLLFSVFTVLPLAASTEKSTDTEEDSDVNVIYNRTFDEGWNYDNGFAYKSISTNTVTVDHEEDSLGKYNYFVRYEATSNNAANTRINFGTEAVTHASKNTVGGTVIELSLKADDIAHLGILC